MLMNVPSESITVTGMLCVQTTLDRTPASADLVSLGMAQKLLVKVILSTILDHLYFSRPTDMYVVV